MDVIWKGDLFVLSMYMAHVRVPSVMESHGKKRLSWKLKKINKVVET